jgi:hypothetical protein
MFLFENNPSFNKSQKYIFEFCKERSCLIGILKKGNDGFESTPFLMLHGELVIPPLACPRNIPLLNF